MLDFSTGHPVVLSAAPVAPEPLPSGPASPALPKPLEWTTDSPSAPLPPTEAPPAVDLLDTILGPINEANRTR